MSQEVSQVPMVAMPKNNGYPTIENMTTNITAPGTIEQVTDETNDHEHTESSLLR